MLCMLKIKRVQSCSEGLCLILVGCFTCLCGPQSCCLSRVTNPFWKGRRVVTRQRLISWPSRLDLEPPLNFVAITEIYQRMCLLVTWEVIVRTRGKKERHSVGIKLMNDFFLNLFSSGSFIFPQHGPVSLKRSLLIILFTRKFSVCLLISFLFLEIFCLNTILLLPAQLQTTTALYLLAALCTRFVYVNILGSKSEILTWPGCMKYYFTVIWSHVTPHSGVSEQEWMTTPSVC